MSHRAGEGGGDDGVASSEQARAVAASQPAPGRSQAGGGVHRG